MATIRDRRLKLIEKISKTLTKKYLEDPFLDVDTMRVLLKARGITTLAQYREWHTLNRIKWAPKSPSTIPGYQGANHLFGTIFYTFKQRRDAEMISYDEMRRIIAPMRFQTMEQYRAWYATLNNLEQYVFPKSPERYFGRRGTWGGSAEFLGKNVNFKLKEKEVEVRYWVLFRLSGDEEGSFRFRDFDSVSLGTLADDSNFTPIAVYEHEPSLVRYVQMQLDVHSMPDSEEGSKGKRIINNLSPLLFELDTNLLKLRIGDVFRSGVE